VPIERWIEAARAFRGGSPQWRRRAALGALGSLTIIRWELGLPSGGPVRVELRDGSGRSRERILPLVGKRTPDRQRRPGEDRILPGNVGYLRIGAMDDAPPAVAWLLRAMQTLRSTDGLIIDVRENGGGSRLLLRLLFPYFMASSDEPRIGNVARHRLSPEDPPDARDGYLADRFLYPREASVYSAEERACIDRFAARFEPEWTPPAGPFSDWHYLLLGRRSAPEGVYHYDRPVVLLIDAGAFSATDVFVGSFKGWRDVTLMGTATGGGSGRAKSFYLPASGIEGRFSTMASFQPGGLLYDGRGVEPDVVAAETVDDWLGRTDSVLEAARRRLAG
jgi:C-terminal processing protease CtpA/Prc